MTIFFLVLLGIPAFGWVQYRQAQNLERLTDQGFACFEWDAFKLELRLMSLREAVLDVLNHPGSPQQLARASSEYNLFAGHVMLIDQGSSRQAMEDQAIFQTVLTQALAFLKQADPLLEEVRPVAGLQPMQLLYEQTADLQAAVHRLVLQAHELKAFRSTQMIREVQSLDYYFAALSAVAVVLGAGWGLSAMRNLTQSSRRQQELSDLYQQSSFSASHDFLTGLANRRLLCDQLQHAIASSKRNALYGLVIILDLDNFKPVNDSFGHDAGDSLLIEVANRMKKCVRDVDTVARIGGDEFAVLLGQVESQPAHASATASVVARKLLDALSLPYELSVPGKTSQPKVIQHVCTVSLGVSLFFKDRLTGDQIMQAADAAMYRAKQAGGNRVELAVVS